MISSVECLKLFFLGVRSLCFLIVMSELGLVVCNSIQNEESSFIFPPQSLASPYPRLLHERDVIRYHDANGQFVSIGSGTYANVTLGELSSSGTHVVVKSFKNSPFRDILKEIRLHRYVEQLGITPILIGLLPSGPLAGNISLVYEYISYSKSLDDWLDNYKALSTAQWLFVCRQIALALLRLHQHDVLFNDLHRGNVLIEKRGAKIRVYLIDFGFATYKHGKTYTSSYGNFSGYNFIAPEVANRSPSTPATDVFALGYTFHKIADAIRLTPLLYLAKRCMALEVADRPSLLTIIANLDSVLFGESLKQFQQKYKKNIYNKKIHAEFNSVGLLTLTKEKKAVVWEHHLFHPTMLNHLSSMTASNSDREGTDEWMWLTQNELVLFEKCPSPLFVIDEHDVIAQHTEEIVWLSRAANDAIRLAELKLTNQTVIIKEFYEVQFEKMREETCITAFLGEKDVSPKIIGLLIEYKRMQDIAFVQEFYGYGVSVAEFVSMSSGHEWNFEILEKIAEREIVFGNQENSLFVLLDSCVYNASRIFLDLTLDRSSRISPAISYRRSIMEVISTLMINKMISVHDSGYLINNFRTNNILVKWNGSKVNRFSIDIRLIDLGLTSTRQGIYLERDLNYLPQFSYLAPEVIRGHRTSKASDIYSLCFAIYQVLQDYFPSSVKSFNSESYLQITQDFEKLYGNFVSYQTANDPYSTLLRYQHLLLKCIHGPPSKRPQLKDLLSASSVVF